MIIIELIHSMLNHWDDDPQMIRWCFAKYYLELALFHQVLGILAVNGSALCTRDLTSLPRWCSFSGVIPAHEWLMCRHKGAAPLCRLGITLRDIPFLGSLWECRSHQLQPRGGSVSFSAQSRHLHFHPGVSPELRQVNLLPAIFHLTACFQETFSKTLLRTGRIMMIVYPTELWESGMI